jgi:hypothetical protein
MIRTKIVWLSRMCGSENIEFLKSSEKPQSVLLMVAPSGELPGQATPIQ